MIDYEDNSSEDYGSIGTSSGQMINPFNPDPDTISMRDIITALKHTNRFGGHTVRPYSVLTHSCMLFDYGNNVVGSDVNGLRWALLHDAAEAYIGDVPRPIKHAIPRFVEIDKHLTKVIAQKYDIQGEMPEWLKFADKNIVRDEAMQLFEVEPDWAHFYEPLNTNVPDWDVDVAWNEFLTRLFMVYPEDVLER